MTHEQLFAWRNQMRAACQAGLRRELAVLSAAATFSLFFLTWYLAPLPNGWAAWMDAGRGWWPLLVMAILCGAIAAAGFTRTLVVSRRLRSLVANATPVPVSVRIIDTEEDRVFDSLAIVHRAESESNELAIPIRAVVPRCDRPTADAFQAANALWPTGERMPMAFNIDQHTYLLHTYQVDHVASSLSGRGSIAT
ncbi:MAG: hypothetical protein AAGA03_04735 [Planctomycetota bacterium]